MGKDDELTEREAEILETIEGHAEQFDRAYVTCGTIAGLLGYRGTAECPAGRIAGGVLGRMHSKGIVDKSGLAEGETESDRMQVGYRASAKGLELLKQYKEADTDEQ